ncbi:MAG: hypothetical protein GYA47_06555 [Desulfovibrio sp.]|nr:hypothetical protein [Desulfovibrio sp.]
MLAPASARPDASAAAALSRADSILVALDSDKAGALAWDNPDPTQWTWRARYSRAVRWPVPVGKDPGEAFAQGLDVTAWVIAGLPPVMTLRRLPDGLGFLRGVGGFLADAPDSGSTRRLGEFLVAHAEAGLRLVPQDGGSLNFEFPTDWDDARRDEVWALWDDAEDVIFGGGN